MPENGFKLEVIAPILAVTQMDRALRYYTQSLGFETNFEWADNPDEPIRYAILRQGNTELHLTLADQPKPVIAYIFTAGIDAAYLAMQKAGASISEEIANQAWDMREFEVTDLDGNRIIFGEHLSRL